MPNSGAKRLDREPKKFFDSLTESVVYGRCRTLDGRGSTQTAVPRSKLIVKSIISYAPNSPKNKCLYMDVIWYSVRSLYQYNETNVMHFPFSLLKIKGLYLFQALLAHPQEAHHKQHLAYCVCTISAGCGTVAVYARNIPNAFCVSASWGSARNARNI
jgi:hypothetical protein